ncbi:Secreted protein OS=Streptomyces antimycoticus OX=68175 GN=SANT12839_013880 PE=4 SV=1 [Streptomyces antimycoticus]
MCPRPPRPPCAASSRPLIPPPPSARPAPRYSPRSPAPSTPELPLPVHVLDDITTADGPPRTRLTGWRFLIRDGNRTVAAAEAMLTADGWAFSHFSEGPYVSSAELALSQAESLPSGYQPRLLSIPELYMVTLWLHGDLTADGAEGGLGAGDLLVPLAPAPPGIAPHRAHRATDLLPVLTHRLTRAPLLGSPA